MAEKRQRKVSSRLRDENNVATAAIRVREEDQGTSRTTVPSVRHLSVPTTDDEDESTSDSDKDGEASITVVHKKQQGPTKRRATEHEHARKQKRTKIAPETCNDSEIEEIEKPTESAEEERG